jgi:aspartyl protease family protein
MKLDAEDRVVPALEPESRWFWYVAAAIVCACVVGALAAFPPTREYLTGLLFGVQESIGVRPVDDRYAAVYQRLGLAPLPAKLLASSQVSSGLTRLAQEPCDKTAIFAFGEGLASANEYRRAADAYAGFAATCPNGEPEQYRAAEMLFMVGDTEKVIAITNGLIVRNPAIASYRYLRGRAFANAKRYADAVEDYKSTIELYRNPGDIGEWVFVELANIYATIGRPCDAGATILAWIAIDPSARNTLSARKKVEAYSAKGCAPDRPSVNERRL